LIELLVDKENRYAPALLLLLFLSREPSILLFFVLAERNNFYRFKIRTEEFISQKSIELEEKRKALEAGEKRIQEGRLLIRQKEVRNLFMS
jgi:hypothetical protein